MTVMDYVGVIRRRLWLVVLLVLLAVIAVFTVGRPAGPLAPSFSGSALLSVQSGAKPTDVAYYDYVARSTSAILDSASVKAGESGQPVTSRSIQKHLKTTPNPEVGVLRVDVVGQPSEGAAQTLLQSYGRALIEFATAGKAASRDAALKTADARVASLEQQISALQDQMRSKGGPSSGGGSSSATTTPTGSDLLITAQLTTLLTAHNTAVADAEALRNQSIDSLSPLSFIGSPLVSAENQARSPLGFEGRLLVGALIGLILGVGLAFGLHRFDRRIYTRRDAETAFQLPVLAEIPAIPYAKRRNFQLIAQQEPTAPASEAYRILRSSIDHARLRQIQGEGERAGRATVVLVTSASRRVGTSTTIANLAVVSVYAGKKVLVVSANLRWPSIHHFFRVESGPGLVDFVDDRWRRPAAIDFSAYVQNTVVPDVSIIHHGREVISAGETVAAAGPMLEVARQRYDIVLVDSPSMRAGSDVNELVAFADLVLLVTRAGRTTSDEGEMVYEMAERMQAPMCGLALVGTQAGGWGSWPLLHRPAKLIRDRRRADSPALQALAREQVPDSGNLVPPSWPADVAPPPPAEPHKPQRPAAPAGNGVDHDHDVDVTGTVRSGPIDPGRAAPDLGAAPARPGLPPWALGSPGNGFDSGVPDEGHGGSVPSEPAEALPQPTPQAPAAAHRPPSVEAPVSPPPWPAGPGDARPNARLERPPSQLHVNAPLKGRQSGVPASGGGPELFDEDEIDLSR